MAGFALRPSNELGKFLDHRKQRHSNYALLARTSEEFVHLLTDNLPAAPEYSHRKWTSTGRAQPRIAVASTGGAYGRRGPAAAE